MQDQFVLYEPSGVQDILAGLSRQVKAVAFGVSYATDDGMSYTQNALWGMSDILHKVAAAMDDLVELPLPSLEELGGDAEIARVAQIRMRNRKAEDLLFRIRQLGRFQRVDLTERLQAAFRKMGEVERGLLELYIDDADEDLIAKVKALKGASTEAVETLEASLGDLRMLNSQVAQIHPIIEEVQEDQDR